MKSLGYYIDLLNEICEGDYFFTINGHFMQEGVYACNICNKQSGNRQHWSGTGSSVTEAIQNCVREYELHYRARNTDVGFYMRDTL